MTSCTRMTVLHAAIILALVTWAWPAAAQEQRVDDQAPSSVGASVPLYDDLGEYHYPITTSEPLAQRYFDQGLRLYYAFNHAEAIRAFEEAARLDPVCAMCYWGIALSYGPNINVSMGADAAASAYGALQKALKPEMTANVRERAIIHALAARYVASPVGDRGALDRAYASSMRRVVDHYPEDLDAATLYAESLMDLSPWNYWTRGGKPHEDTLQILSQLERVMAKKPDHPGANHFYIHAVEAVQPRRALAAAERLANLMPGAGHLVHMPAHIYVRVGRFADAIAANEHAVHADEVFIRDQKPMGVYVVGYYPHNYDFLSFAASMIGRSDLAIASAEKIASLVPQALLREPGMTFLQLHQTKQLQMKVRFARWDQILEEAVPPEDLPLETAIWHYARGRALAAQGQVQAAEAELAGLRAIALDPGIASLQLEFNTVGSILQIATSVLTGHIAVAKGDDRRAISELRKAVHLEDALVYGEPPEWAVPVRQDLAVVLLHARQAAMAELVFREDLKRFPENGWSLKGLAEALQGQRRKSEADRVTDRFRKIWAGTDT